MHSAVPDGAASRSEQARSVCSCLGEFASAKFSLTCTLRKRKTMDKEYKIPAHVAIIMDGNGRWAKKRGLPRTAGHAQGARVVEIKVFLFYFHSPPPFPQYN